MTRLLLACVLMTLATPLEAGVRGVWALHDGDKVERDARAHPARDRNAVWDGRTIRFIYL